MAIAPVILSLHPELDARQREVVGHVDGPLPGIAGPGAGKTQSIQLRAINLLLTGKAAAGGLLLDPPPEMTRNIDQLTLRDVDLSYIGRKTPRDPIHQAIAGLQPGDPLQVRTDRNPWELATPDGKTVGRLARSYAVPKSPKETTATVLAIAVWEKSKSSSQFQAQINTDRWEVVIPEITSRNEDGPTG